MLKLSADEAALLKAVCADRDADLPRLVYADWLDDRGRSERAELIRLQVTAERERTDHTRYHLAPRIDELLAAHRDRWLRELPKWAVGVGLHEFTRGFVEQFMFPAGLYLMYAPQLLDRTPVRRLTLQSVQKLVRKLPRCGWLGEVPELWLNNGYLGDDDIVELVRSEWLAHTRSLNLIGNNLTDRAARALAGCPLLGRLECLMLGRNTLTRAGVESLLASPHLTGCQFELGGNPRLNDDYHGIRRLLGSRGTL